MAQLKVKAVIFDLDNTLVDFLRMKLTSVDAAIAAMIASGLPMSHIDASKLMYELYDKYGIEYNLIFQRFLEKAGTEIDYHVLAAGIIAYRKAQAGIIEPYPQVMPTLLKLREKGLKLAILSDAPRLKAWLRLVELKLDSFFDIVVTFDDTGKTKPDSEPFEKVLEKLNLQPEDCVMVGDWPERDLVGAKKAGLHTIFAKYGYFGKDKPADIADFEINSISGLLKLLA